MQAARDLGISTGRLSAWVQQGRLLHPAPGAYVIAGSPSTWRQRVSIAAISSSSWASHRSAAVLWGLEGFEPRQIEVLRQRWLRRQRAEWVVHETRRVRGIDLDEVDGRGRTGTRLMRRLLDERLGRGTFTQSGFETMAVRLVRSIGLPEPVLQHHVREGSFSAYLDLAWPDILWAVECDSLAYHSGKRSHEWDRYRRRRLKALGWDLIEITYDDVTKRAKETGRQLRQLYEARRSGFGVRQPR